MMKRGSGGYVVFVVCISLWSQAALAFSCNALSSPHTDASAKSGSPAGPTDSLKFAMEGCAEITVFCGVTFYFTADLNVLPSSGGWQKIASKSRSDIHVTPNWQIFSASSAFDLGKYDLYQYPDIYSDAGLDVTVDVRGHQPECSQTIDGGGQTLHWKVRNTPYKTIPLYKHYSGESTACVWQNPQSERCPPYVKYASKAELAALKLTVKPDGLYTSAGRKFDTAYADTGHDHKNPKAIFVMGKYGEIYASNSHPVFLFHHSSFFSGGEVAAAGELVVSNGKIKEMTSCSGHYRPTDAITRQAIDSLSKQGYPDANKINFTGCSPNVMKRLIEELDSPHE